MKAGDSSSITNIPPAGVTITIQGLGKRFNREWIFRNLTASFTSGNIYAITGPNGSGKSTLLQILWGQVPASAGQLDYYHHNSKVSMEDIYKHITIATPYMDLIEEFTLLEQLQFHFKLKKIRSGLTIEKVMELMYLQDARDKHIANFSSGMKQRLKLGLAFFTAADIVFLDEPGTNLDQQAFHWYNEQLKNLPEDCLIFIASNQSSEYPESAHKIDILTFK